MDERINKDPVFLDLLGQGQPLQAQKYLVDTYKLEVVDASLRVRAMQCAGHASAHSRLYRVALRFGQVAGLALVALSIYAMVHLNALRSTADNRQDWPQVTAEQWQQQGERVRYHYQVAGVDYQAEQENIPALQVASRLASLSGKPLMVAYQAAAPATAYLYADISLYAITALGLLMGLVLLAVFQFLVWCHLRAYRRPSRRPSRA